MAEPGFWDDPDAAQKMSQDVNGLKEETGIFRSLEQRVEDLDIMWDMEIIIYL